ncbi:MAG TPA: hypothetical protein VI612_04420 [Candidatus Nanoarchaeia archaeon]|nr:hypothetical protein [Candidatus Nanoarchaeia archaeon]
MEVPKELSDLVLEKSERIQPVFGIVAPPPRIEIRTDIPQDDVMAGASACFAYQMGTNDRCIWVDAGWYEANKTNIEEVHWAIAEETAHYCHHNINFPLWDETADIETRQMKKKWKHGNHRIWELKNLAEMVARIGGMYAGLPPPDFGKMMSVWDKIMEMLKGMRGPEEIDAYCEANPVFGRALYHTANRVWGCHIGDMISRQSEVHCLPKPELVRGLARCSTFREAAEVYFSFYPEKDMIRTYMEMVAQNFFTPKTG